MYNGILKSSTQAYAIIDDNKTDIRGDDDKSDCDDEQNFYLMMMMMMIHSIMNIY